MLDGVRAFVAVPLSAEVQLLLARLIDELRPRIPRVRWVAPQSIHLTLRFLGESAPDRLENLARDLRRAAGECPPGSARLAGLGLFPERGRPGVLWLGITLPPQVIVLQAACEAAAVRHGWLPENRPYRPHLTLGRWREKVPRPVLPDVDLGAAPLEALSLMRSELHPQGARYTTLARFVLGAGGSTEALTESPSSLS